MKRRCRSIRTRPDVLWNLALVLEQLGERQLGRKALCQGPRERAGMVRRHVPAGLPEADARRLSASSARRSSAAW